VRFNADTQTTELLAKGTVYSAGVMPRKTVYGSAPGLIPFGERHANRLLDPADYKETIEFCHRAKLFPIYHQHHTWAKPGFRWNQNGLPYCWTWGLTGTLMDCRAREGKPTVLLSPVTLGWLVNWAPRGHYLGSAVRGAMERGIAPLSYTPDPHSRNHRGYKPGWEDAALGFRLAEAWDTDVRDMIRHCLTILSTGTPLYIAYNWWRHALACVGVLWDESQPNNLVWLIRNSHNESDVIEMTGSRAVPDEAIGIRASLTEV